MPSRSWFWRVCLLLTTMLWIGVLLPLDETAAQTESPDAAEVEPQDDQDAAPEKAETETEEPDDQPSQEKERPEDESSDDTDTDDDSDSESSDDDDADEQSDEKPQQSGSDDMAEAFSLKIAARTVADLDRIAALCESALDKGLGDSETRQAKYLASESLFRFAESLARRTFITPRDRRWQAYRAQAIPRLRRAVKFDPENVGAFILLAKFQAIDRRERGEALKNIEKAIELSAEDRGQLSDALVIRGALTEDKDARIADLKQAIKLNPVNYQAREMRGRMLLADQKVDEAMKDFDVLLDAQPDNFVARIFVATTLRGTGDLFTEPLRRRVIELLDEASKIQPKSEVPSLLKGQIFFQQMQYEQAIDAVSMAIELNPKAPAPYSARALTYAAIEQWDEAYDDAAELIKLDATAGYRLRVDLYGRQQRFEAAIEDLELLSSSQPNDINLKRRLAIFYSSNLQPAKAIRIYNRLLRPLRAVDLDTTDNLRKIAVLASRADLLSLRGNARLATGEHVKAAEDYRDSLAANDQLIELDPSNGAVADRRRNSGLLNNYAWLLATSPELEVRDGQLAIDLAEEAAEITDFKQPHILSTVASAYAETGDFATAIDWIKRGIEVNEAVAAERDDAQATARQHDSLMKEWESYKQNKPWRELQDIEAERRERDARQADDKDANKDEDGYDTDGNTSDEQ